MFKKICPNCGKEFKGKRGDAKFCSRPCQNQFNYKHRSEQVSGLGGLGNLKIVKSDSTHNQSLNELIESKPEYDTAETVRTLPPYKTPMLDSDSMNDFLGDAGLDENTQAGDQEQDEQEQLEDEIESEPEKNALPEKFITKQFKTDNPLYTYYETFLNQNQSIKQKLEQELAKLEAQLKFQQSRTGNDIIALGAIGGSFVGWQSPSKDKEAKEKDEMILKNKDGKPILRSVKNKWQKIKSKKGKSKKVFPINNEPSFLEKLPELLLYGILGTTVGAIAKAATEDYREKDKKEKIAAIKKRMDEIRRDYALLKQTISNTQKQLGQTPRFLFSNKLVINPEYEKTLSGLNKEPEKEINKISNEASRFKSDKVIRATDLVNQTFSSFNFKGVWREFFGLPSTNFHILIHGNSGEGKSTFCLWFAKYLAENFGVVLYVSGEEGTNKTFYDKLKFCAANVKDLHILDVRTGDEFMQEINENEAHFIFLDSLHDMNIDAEKLKQIFQKYKNSAFICIDQNNKKGDLLGANEKKHICDVVVNVKNYTAETTKNRFKAKGMVFKTEEFPGSDKQSPFKAIRKEDNDRGYNLDSDRRGIV